MSQVVAAGERGVMSKGNLRFNGNGGVDSDRSSCGANAYLPKFAEQHRQRLSLTESRGARWPRQPHAAGFADRLAEQQGARSVAWNARHGGEAAGVQGENLTVLSCVRW